MARDSLTSRVGLAIKALREGHSAMPGPMIDPDDDLFSRITGERRDLNPVAQDRAREVSFYLWRSNPVARRLVEMIVDFVVGDGLTLGAVDDNVLDVINEFWHDPLNQLDLRHRDLVRDQSLAGEMAIRVYTAEQGGRTRIGLIDPPRIGSVAKHPENALVDKVLWLRGRGGMQETPVPLVYLDDETDPANPRLVGEAFYFPVNRPLMAGRGTPDLLALADWIDGYDQMLWNLVERSAFQNAFVWDVTLEGQDQTSIDTWVRAHGAAPKPGTVRAHNEKEVWAAVSPDLGAAQAEIGTRLIKNLILGGAGVPEGWFADGDSANRATLSEQGDPTYKMLKRRQVETKAAFEALLGYVVDRAIAGGRLPTNADRTVVVNIPEASDKDIKGLAAALPQLQTALDAAIAAKAISRKSARELFLSVASGFGIELDPEDEEEQIEEEQAEADEEADAAMQAAQDAAGTMAAQAALLGTPPTSPPDGPGGPQAPAPVAEATLAEHANHKAMGPKGGGGVGGGGGGASDGGLQEREDAAAVENRRAMQKGEAYRSEAEAKAGMRNLRAGDQVRVEVHQTDVKGNRLGVTHGINGTVNRTNPKAGTIQLSAKSNGALSTIKASEVAKITLTSKAALPSAGV